MRQTQNQFFGLDSDKHPSSVPGAIYIATDTKKIYVYDIYGKPKLVSGSGGGGGSILTVDFFTDLPGGMDENSTAFVLYKQGTSWLPGSLGGTYYPAGWYIYRSGNWTSIEVPVDQALKDYGDLIAGNTTSISNHLLDLANPHQVSKSDVGLSNVDNTSDTLKPISTAGQNALDLKSNIGHNHNKADIADFNELDYATATQGTTADTAIQPGDNISTLFNDEVYLQPSDNVSALTNDAGYISGNTVTSLRTDIVVSDLYTGYLINSVPTIKKYNAGVETFAQSVTDLETDWTNRLSLTYI